MIKITAMLYAAAGQTAADLAAAVLETQHERSLMGVPDVRSTSTPGLFSMRAVYDDGAAVSEVEDAAERVEKTRCGGVDSVRIVR